MIRFEVSYGAEALVAPSVHTSVRDTSKTGSAPLLTGDVSLFTRAGSVAENAVDRLA